MNKFWIIIGIVLLAGAVGFMVYKVKDNSASYYQEQKAIDSLGVIINTLKEQELRLDSTIGVYKHDVVSLGVTVARDKHELEEIKKQQHETINNVRGYNATQLDSFFTNRYHVPIHSNVCGTPNSH
jgi:hypothetical protein